MNLINQTSNYRENLQNANRSYTNVMTHTAGNNGLTGFKSWECYMLVKYGYAGNFGKGDDYEYLLELPLYPDSVTENINAQWETQSVLGRSAPLSAYAGTSLKSVNFDLTLHRDLLTGSFSHNKTSLEEAGGTESEQAAGFQHQTAKGPFSTRTWYTNANKMLQISCYPQYTSAGLIPPTTYFVFGQMILKGFVNSYSTTWKKPILNTFYGWNTVSINMDCYPDSIVGASDIMSGNGSASTQNTYNTKFPDNIGNSDVMQRLATTNRNNLRNSSSIGGSPIDT